MSSTPFSPSIQICRDCGGGAPVDVHFCPQCTKILAIGRQGDYFAFLGVPRRLHLDAGELEQRFRSLSRQFHPDFYYNATPAERRASLERSSYLNDAYRTLRQPVTRIAYLLEIEGVWTATDRQQRGASAAVPPALLEEVFELNEELDNARALRASGAAQAVWQAKLEAAARPIEARRVEHERQLEELSTRWDAAAEVGDAAEKRATLEALRARMLERHYISNLLSTIEHEMAGPSSSSDPGADAGAS